MNALELAPLVRDNFGITPICDGITLRLKFSGNADMEARGPLEGFLRRLQSQMVGTEVRHVVCDVQNLYFMNSACFKCFVQWIHAIANSPIDERYSLVFIKNKQMPWQARSLESLRHFGPSIVLIRDEL